MSDPRPQNLINDLKDVIDTFEKNPNIKLWPLVRTVETILDNIPDTNPEEELPLRKRINLRLISRDKEKLLRYCEQNQISLDDLISDYIHLLPDSE